MEAREMRRMPAPLASRCIWSGLRRPLERATKRFPSRSGRPMQARFLVKALEPLDG